MTGKPSADEKIGHEKYQRLIAAAQKETTVKVAVAHPCDDVSLSGAIEAHKLGLIDPIRSARRSAFETQPKRLISTSAGSSSSRRRIATIRRQRRSGSSLRAGSRR